MHTQNIQWLRLATGSALLTLLGLTLFAYLHALDNQWVSWDTSLYVLNNPHIQQWTWENFYWMWGVPFGNWTPLTWLSHALTYSAFELDSRGHHLVNLLLHLGNTLLVFALTAQLWRCAQRAPEGHLPPFNVQHLLAASLAALLFGIHPQHVESVAWVAERKGMLCAFFTLLTVLSYCQYVLALHTGRAVRWYMATLVLFAAALMSKPVVTPLTLVLLCLDFYPLQRRGWLRLVLEKLPFLALTVGISVIAWFGQQQGGAFAATGSIDIVSALLTAMSNTLLYLNKWLLPVTLLPFYPADVHYQDLYSWRTVVALVGVIGITFLTLYAAWRRQPVGLVAWLSYLLLLAPVSGIVQISLHSAAHRFAYIPTIPFYIVLGIGLAYLWMQISVLRKVVLMLCVVLVVTLLITLTRQQTLIWRNDLSLWSYMGHMRPESAYVNNLLGRTYLTLGRYQEAIPHLQQAATRVPEEALFGLGYAYSHLGEDALALAHYQKMLVLNLEYPYGQERLYYQIAILQARLGEIEAALAAVERMLVLVPDSASGLALQAQLLAE